jgi:hypothetical protein
MGISVIRQKFRLSFLCLLALLLCVGIGCKSRLVSYPSLADEGLLGLSSENPYLGGNLFVAAEAARSPIFFKFLETRGSPTAIRLSSNATSAPDFVMYYHRDQQSYAVTSQTFNGQREWIVRGPYPIHRRDYKTLRSLGRLLQGEPVLLIGGKMYRFTRPTEREAPIVVRPQLPLPVPTKKPKPKPKQPAAEVAVVVAAPTANPLGFDPAGPLNSDQRAILKANGYADRNDAGDVVHTLVAGESLADVAKWYTGSPEKAAEIAKENQLEGATPPAAGAKLRIPKAMVTNFKAKQ